MKKSKNQGGFIRSYWVVLALAVLFILAGTALAASNEASVIKLKYGSYAPKSNIDDPVLWFLSEVSKRSGVKIEVETYFSGTLAKPMDCLDALTNRVYDIGWISPIFTPTKTALSAIPASTPLVAPSLYSATKSADEVYRSFQPAADEFKKANVMFLFNTGVWQYELISSKPVKTLADLKGLRVRTFGYQSKALDQLGGVPVTIPIPEAYDSLQKGVIDAVLTQPYGMLKSLRLFEVAKNFTYIQFGVLPTPVIMNMDTWNNLPEKVQIAMLAVAEDMPALTEKIIGEDELAAIEDMQKQGLNVYTLPEADKARITEVGKEIANMFVDDLTAKGVVNAKETMSRYLELLEKYAK